MRPFSLLVAGAAVLGCSAVARAQGQGQVPQQPLPATTVQLPTFSVFTVQTTVSVPDGGGSYLGGLNRGADSSITRGPFGNRALASPRGASGMSVHAKIIDRDEMDRSVLAAAGARRAASDPTAAKAAELTMAVAKSAAPTVASRTTSAAALPGSVTALRERNVAAAADERAGETAGYFAAAQKAEADGKLGVAKVYYQMVARRDSGQLKQHAEARLAALAVGQASRLSK